jgi:CRISPR type I-D-associated protein Csc1
MILKTYRVTLVPHDFFFFATFDYHIGIPQDAIHNYSLMYALWEKGRFASACTPHYLEDLVTMQFYATPARPIGEPDTLRWGTDRPTHFDRVKMTYNSISELSTQKMEQVTVNIPVSGVYYKFPPLTYYEFFLLSKQPMKGLIRIGKKSCIARLQYEELINIFHIRGTHAPNHLVNIADIPKGTVFKEGRFLYGFPTPLIAEGMFDSDFIQAEDSKGKRLLIQMPNIDLYQSLQELNNLPSVPR